MCLSIYVCLFHGNHERRELCMYARQVLNCVSNGTQGCSFFFFYVFMCVHVFMYESFYWCAHCTPGP